MTEAACATCLASLPTRSSRAGDHLGQRRRKGRTGSVQVICYSAGQLLQEERHALRTRNEGGAHVAGQSIRLRELFDQGSCVITVETGEAELRVEVARAGPPRSRAGRSAPRGPGQLSCAIRCTDSSGARVSPVGIIDDQQHGTVPGEALDPVSRFSRCGGHLPHQLAKGVEWTQDCSPVAQERQHGVAVRAEVLAELEEQARLADPGFARDQDELPGPALDSRPLFVQPLPSFRARHEDTERTCFQSVTRPTALQHPERRDRIADALQRVERRGTRVRRIRPPIPQCGR